MALFSFVALKTLFLIVIWISMGLCVQIFGPTLKDLVAILNTDYESVSRSIGVRSIGACAGSIVAGVLADKFPRWLDLMIVIFTTMTAIATGLVSMATSTDQMLLLCLQLGFGVQGIHIVGQRLIIIMWKEKSASPTHALHMGFGIGALLIPLIASPFLMVTEPLTANLTASTMNISTPTFTLPQTAAAAAAPSSNATLVNASTATTAATLNSSLSSSLEEGGFFSPNISGVDADYRVITESNARYVFILVGILCGLSSAPFLVYQCLNSERCNPMFRKISEDEVKKTESIGLCQMLNPASYTGGSMCFGLMMFALLFVYYTGTVGGEQLFGTFIRTYSVDVLQFTRDKASYLLMLYWVAFTLSRGLGAILSLFVHIKHLILVQAVLAVASVTTLNLIEKTSTNLWVFAGLQGLIYAPLFPMGISFANTVIDVRGFCLTIIMLAAGLGDLGYIWIAGKLYDYFGPHGVMNTMQAAVISVAIAVVGFRLITRRRKAFHGGKKFHTAPEKLDMSMSDSGRSDERAGLLETSEDEL